MCIAEEKSSCLVFSTKCIHIAIFSNSNMGFSWATLLAVLALVGVVSWLFADRCR
ncbi:MAG: hypothetical protein ACI4AH_02195 [Muribaculaceae bacterium]